MKAMLDCLRQVSSIHTIKADLLHNTISAVPRAQKLFENFGFSFACKKPRFWSKEKGFCPDCVSNPCKCIAYEYILKLKQ